MGSGVGGINFWVIGITVAGFIQYKYVKPSSERLSFLMTLSGISLSFIIFYSFIKSTSFLIPQSVLDYEWYRMFWILYAPLVLGYLVFKGQLFNNGIKIFTLKVPNQSVAISLLLITYTLPGSQLTFIAYMQFLR